MVNKVIASERFSRILTELPRSRSSENEIRIYDSYYDFPIIFTCPKCKYKLNFV